MGKKSKRNKGRAKSSAATAPSSAASVPPPRAAAGRVPDPYQPTTKSELDAIATPRVVSSDKDDPVKAPRTATCWICLEGVEDGNTEPLRRNCACRGESQSFAHLSCLVDFFTARSEDIWCGRQKAAEGTNELAFAWPWESCSTCKQWFCGKLRLDLAREFARSTEGMVGGVRAFRHINALSWLIKSLLDYDIGESTLEIAALESDKLLNRIKESYAIYEYDDRQGPLYNFTVEYIGSNMRMEEGQVLANYAHVVSIQLRMMLSESEKPSSVAEQRKLYNKWQRLSTSATETFKGLKSTIFGGTDVTGQQVDSCIINLQATIARTKRDFAQCGFKDIETTKKDDRDVIDLSKKHMNTAIQQRGETSAEGIKCALIHAQNLMTMIAQNAKPFTALDLLEKTFRTSTQSLGPMHAHTKSALFNMGCLFSNQRVAHRDNAELFCPVLRYKEDDGMYIVKTKDLDQKDGEDVSEEITWDPSDVILKCGALVVCTGLVNAAHLNGKRGWVFDYNGKRGRHAVGFEDDDAKSCLVKPGNIRLLLFDEPQHRAGCREYEEFERSHPH